MASKTVTNPDGTTRKVLVGSKADTEYQAARSTAIKTRYSGSSPSIGTSRSVTLADGTKLGKEDAKRYGRTPAPLPLGDEPPVSSETQMNDPAADKPDEETSDYVPRFFKPETSQTPEPQDVESIQRKMKRDAQGEINSLRDYERTRLEEQAVLNDKEAASTRATNVLSGLSGSSEADAAAATTADKGAKANERIRASVEMEVQGVLSQIRKDAVLEARSQREDYRLDEAARIENEAARTQLANENLTKLTAAGVTFDGLRKTDPRSFEYLARQYGSTEALKGAFVLNTPQDQILDKGIKGGSYFIAKQNPITGKVSVETVDLGLPPEYTKTMDAGDRIVAIPDGWDGDTSKLISIRKGLSPAQSNNAPGIAPGDNPQLYSGLTSPTATAVRSKVTSFKSEPTVQNFATIQEGNNFAQSLDTNTKNPADDQALIYSLAKALDPGSVVREGEYATAQKYAQSWVAAYGKGVEQALLGTGFLSKSARENIKNTIGQKFDASKASYDNIYRQYGNSINSLTGRSDGSKFLVDYATPSNSGVLTSPDGTQEVNTADLTPDELEEARAAGWE